MVKVYDMVTYMLCDPTDNATIDAGSAAIDRHAELPQTALGLQEIAATPAPHAKELHPALRHTDVETFISTLER